MKTAREIIAAQVCAELNDVAFADLPEVATYLERKTHIDRPLIDQNEALVSADAILAALAAEGFSIVETGRDPLTIEACAEIAEGGVVFGNQNEVYACGDMMDAWELGADDAGSSVAKAIRALSRSTREGKTE